MRHVTRILKDHPLDPWYCPKPGLDTKLRDFVVTPVQEKSVDLDILCLLGSIPVLQITVDNNLGWALPRRKLCMRRPTPDMERILYSHCVVGGGVILQIVEGLLDRLRHGVNSTDVLLVEKDTGTLVLWGVQLPSSISFL